MPALALGAPGLGDADGAQGVRLDRAGLVADRPGDLDRLVADPLGLDEVAEEHQRLGERGEDPGAEVGHVAGHDRRRAAVLGQRAVVVAERPRRAAEHLVDRRRDLRVLALPEAARGGLEVGQGPFRPAGGEGHLGGLEQEPPVGGAGAARRAQLEGQLAGGQRIRGGVEPLGGLGRGEGRRAGARRLVGREPVGQRRRGVIPERRGEREVMAPALDRQQVVLDGLARRARGGAPGGCPPARRGSRGRSPRRRRPAGPRRGRRRPDAAASSTGAAGHRRAPRTSSRRPRARPDRAAGRPGPGAAGRAGTPRRGGRGARGRARRASSRGTGRAARGARRGPPPR